MTTLFSANEKIPLKKAVNPRLMGIAMQQNQPQSSQNKIENAIFYVNKIQYV
jgi:hypothetical protein